MSSSLNICGWSAEEVASDLKYLIEDKYSDMFSGEPIISTNGVCSITIKNAKLSEMEQLISMHKEKERRSLDAIDKLSESAEGVVIELQHYKVPEMYPYGDRLVSCFLYAPGT